MTCSVFHFPALVSSGVVRGSHNVVHIMCASPHVKKKSPCERDKEEPGLMNRVKNKVSRRRAGRREDNKAQTQ